MFLSIEIGVVTIIVGLLEATFGPLCSPIVGPRIAKVLGEMFEAAAVNAWQNILLKEDPSQSKKLKLGFPHLPMIQDTLKFLRLIHCAIPPLPHALVSISPVPIQVFNSHNPSFNVFMGTVGMMDTKLLVACWERLERYGPKCTLTVMNQAFVPPMWMDSRRQAPFVGFVNFPSAQPWPQLGGTGLVHHSENVQVKMLVSPQQPQRPPPHPICLGPGIGRLWAMGVHAGEITAMTILQAITEWSNWIVWKTARLNVWQLSPAARALNIAVVAVRFGPDSHPKYRTCFITLYLHSMKLTVRTCQEAGPLNETGLPTIDFRFYFRSVDSSKQLKDMLFPPLLSSKKHLKKNYISFSFFSVSAKLRAWRHFCHQKFQWVYLLALWMAHRVSQASEWWYQPGMPW